MYIYICRLDLTKDKRPAHQPEKSWVPLPLVKRVRKSGGCLPFNGDDASHSPSPQLFWGLGV